MHLCEFFEKKKESFFDSDIIVYANTFSVTSY